MERKDASDFSLMNFSHNQIFPYSSFPTNYRYTQSNNNIQNMPDNCSFHYLHTPSKISVTLYKPRSSPLIIIDPQNMEVVDLVKASKTIASNQNPSTKIVSEVTDNQFNDETNTKDVQAIVQKDDEVLEEEDKDKEVMKIENGVTEQDNQGEDDDETEYPSKVNSVASNEKDHNNNQNIDHSQAILNEKKSLYRSTKLKISSSDDNIYDISSFVNIDGADKTVKRRLIYDRATFPQLSQSPLFQRTKRNCEEIAQNLSIQNNPMECLNRRQGFKTDPTNKISFTLFKIKVKSIIEMIDPLNLRSCFSEIVDLISRTKSERFSVTDCIHYIFDQLFNKAAQQTSYNGIYDDLCNRIVEFQWHTNDNSEEQKSGEEETYELKKLFKSYIEEQLKLSRENGSRTTESSRKDHYDCAAEVQIQDISQEIKPDIQMSSVTMQSQSDNAYLVPNELATTLQGHRKKKNRKKKNQTTPKSFELTVIDPCTVVTVEGLNVNDWCIGEKVEFRLALSYQKYRGSLQWTGSMNKILVAVIRVDNIASDDSLRGYLCPVKILEECQLSLDDGDSVIVLLVAVNKEDMSYEYLQKIFGSSNDSNLVMDLLMDIVNNNDTRLNDTIIKDWKRPIDLTQYPDLLPRLINQHKYDVIAVLLSSIIATEKDNLQLMNIAKYFLLQRDWATFVEALRHCRDVNYVDDNGETFLTTIIKETKDEEMVERIVGTHMFDINKANNDGDTPLVLACRQLMASSVIVLVANGASVEYRNNMALHTVMEVRKNIVKSDVGDTQILNNILEIVDVLTKNIRPNNDAL